MDEEHVEEQKKKVVEFLQKGSKSYIGAVTEEQVLEAERVMAKRAAELLEEYVEKCPNLLSMRLSRVKQYIRVLEDCEKGCQCCSNCADVACDDNTHPMELQVLKRVVLDFHCQVDDLNRRLRRKDELIQSATNMINKLQKSEREYLDDLKRNIDRNQRRVNEILDAGEEAEDLEWYNKGLLYAYHKMRGGEPSGEFEE